MFKPMSDLEQLLYFKLGEKEQRVFTVQDIAGMLDVSPQHARNLASRMVKKNVAERVKPGLFVRVPESLILDKKFYREDAILIASKSVKKAFLSHYTALSIHGLAERYANEVYVTSLRHHRDIIYHNITIKFIHTSPKRFFGMEIIDYSNEKITVSDKERTILDVVNKPSYSGGWAETINCLKNIEKVNWEKLLSYIIKFDNKILARRIGYIMENLENVSIPVHVKKKIEKLSGKNIYYFDSSGKGFFDKNWNMVVPEKIYEVIHA